MGYRLAAYMAARFVSPVIDRKSTRLNSSHLVISYPVFCLKKKKRYADLVGARRHRGPDRLGAPVDPPGHAVLRRARFFFFNQFGGLRDLPLSPRDRPPE